MSGGDDKRKAPVNPTLQRRRETVRLALRGMVRALATLLLALAFVSLGLRIYMARYWAPERSADAVRPPLTAVERLQTIQQLERLEAALEVYRLMHETYPERLDELVAAGLIGERALRFPDYVQPYFYRRTGESFELHPPRF